MFNKHCCVLSNSGLSNSTSKRPKLAFFRGKICPPQSRNCQNRNSRSSKSVCLLPVCLRNNRYLADQISNVLWNMVKNCERNRSRPDEIDTETEICTSLKYEFYFRFPWPPKKGKERKRIYIAPFIHYVYLKALRHGSHSFTCKYTMPAFPSYAFTRWRHL